MVVDNPAPASPPRIAIFLSTSGHSGVDRAMRHLIPALAGRGYQVDLLKVRRHGPDLRVLPDGVRVIDTGTSTTYGALPALVRYLRRERPAVLLADKDRVNRTALLARWLAGCVRCTHLVLSSGTTISVDLAHRGVVERFVQRLSMGWLYRFADQVIVTCEAVADDMSAYTGLPRAKIAAIASPVVPASLFDAAPPRPQHPWFDTGAAPIVLGVGELSARKDFATLLRAFALLRAEREAHLIIVGKGSERDALQALAHQLGIADDLWMPGFRDDVYSFMAHASVFAMTSRWEGLGFVLIEALACGTPSVAADCPSGPAEVLDRGRVGALVPVGDAPALARGLTRMLDSPPPAAVCRDAARRYEIEAATDDYLRAMALPPRAGDAA